MTNHEKFLEVLKKVIEENFEDIDIERIQISGDNSVYMYITTEKPEKKIVHPAGVEYDTSVKQDKKTKLWVWTY